MKKNNFIIRKLLNDQISVAFIAFFIVISLIIFGNQFFLVLSRSLSEGYLGSELFSLMIFKYFRDIPFVIGFSFSLALVYSLNRLYKSSELIILTNSGFGDFRLFKTLLPLISLVFFLVLVLISFIVPEVNKKINMIKDGANARPEYIFFKEGVFQNFNNERITFYTEKIDNGIMEKLFIYSPQDNRIILSNNGEKVHDEKTGKVFLRLFDGKIYQNIDIRSDKEPSISIFNKLEILLFEPSIAKKAKSRDSLDSISTYVLLFNPNKESFREFLYRLSTSIALIIMSFLSIQFARTNPRNTRNYALGFGLLVYIAYYNFLIYVREAEATSIQEIILNFFSAHLLFILLIFIISLFRNNFSIRN